MAVDLFIMSQGIIRNIMKEFNLFLFFKGLQSPYESYEAEIDKIAKTHEAQKHLCNFCKR